MNNEHLHIELFDCYLKNQLNDFDKKQFDEKLNSDKEFKKQFENYLLVVEGIKQLKRDELKSYFNKNVKMEYWGENFWGKKWTIAAAAAFLIFGSLYIVTSQLNKNNSSQVVLTDNETKENESSSTEEVSSTKNNKEKIEIEKKENEKEIPIIIENEVVESDFNQPETYNFDTKESNISTDDKNEDINSEVLVKTLNDVKLITVSTQEIVKSEESNRIKKAYVKVTEAQKAPSTTAKKDNSEDLSKEKKSEIDANQAAGKSTEIEKKYKVEFWKHPLNFVGYTFNNYTLKIYGFNTENFKIYFLNEDYYIKIESTIYLIKTCENCKLVLITNAEIINQLK